MRTIQLERDCLYKESRIKGRKDDRIIGFERAFRIIWSCTYQREETQGADTTFELFPNVTGLETSQKGQFQLGGHAHNHFRFPPSWNASKLLQFTVFGGEQRKVSEISNSLTPIPTICPLTGREKQKGGYWGQWIQKYPEHWSRTQHLDTAYQVVQPTLPP